MMEKMTRVERFEAWLKKVDAWTWRIAGLSYQDLPDCCYYDMFGDGASPKEAAKVALAGLFE